MSLKVWLPLNGDLYNQGCSPFTITSIEATPTFTAGKIGQCYQRTDSNAQVTKGLRLDDNLINTFGSQASVAVWIKPLGTHTHYNGTILSSGNWNAKKWAFGVSQDNTKVDVLCGSYNNYITCDVPVNVWTHLVSIYDNGTCTLYKNGIYIGQLVNQKAFETDADWTGICRETYASGYFGFNGCINDLRIYDHCLSAAEVREISQGLILHYKLDDITNGIQDSSGYNYNGTITGTISIDSDSSRYQSSIYVNGSSYILTPAGSFAWNDLTQLTFSAWMKPTASMTGWRGSVGIAADANQTARGIAITDYGNEFRGTYTNGSSYATIATGKTLTQNEWHHCAGTVNNTEFKLYFDGVLVKTQTINWGTATLNANARFEVGVDLPGTDEKFTGNYSDVRCYCTALDDDAIRQLYEVGAKIDNKGNLHTYEINENGSNKLKKSGVFYNYASEPYIQLADGSYWKLMLFHYVDKGNNLFTSSNATYNNGFGLYSRLRDINNYKYNNLYEFYVIQDGIEYRWTQTSQPTASSIAGKTVVSGYTDPVNGLAKANQSNTYIGYSSWWGACGCWTSYSTGGKTGIPGFGAHSAAGMCTEYLALYTRIDAITFQIENQNNYASDFIEI